MADTAADIMIETLHDWGVEVVFGLPGDGINGLMEALRTRRDKILLRLPPVALPYRLSDAFSLQPSRDGQRGGAQPRHDPESLCSGRAVERARGQGQRRAGGADPDRAVQGQRGCRQPRRHDFGEPPHARAMPCAPNTRLPSPCDAKVSGAAAVAI